MNKLLKLSQVRKELPFKTHQVNPFFHILDIIKTNKEIDYDVFLPSKGLNLQRPFCWTFNQKQQLILSILKGVEIPKLALLIDANDMNHRVYQIIDGKQRLNAMLSFIKNEFPIQVDGQDYLYEDLSAEAKSVIAFYSPKCEVAYFHEDEPISDDDKIAWFEMINFTGTPQDVKHLNKLKNA